MGFLEEVDTGNLPTIPEFYDGKTLFITGGSGKTGICVMGKVLIEKLLYSCTNLKRIYLLFRSKKGLTPRQRLGALYSSPCFDRLRKERPGAFESKVSIIAGDIAETGLGISEEDREIIVNETNVIFHGAASVRFDDPLSYAVKLNLLGTMEMIKLAKEVQNLDVFVHVSTSYLNTNREEIDEIMYPPVADWRQVISICENIDEQTQRIFTPKLLGILPNTYVFSKQMAENMIYEEKGKLPIVIIRPSVVVSSVEEPAPGWVESLNGPNGICVGVGKGILRVAYADSSAVLDFVPVDLAIRHFIVVSWLRGTRKLETTDDIPIYHCCSGNLRKITLQQLVEIGLDMGRKKPMDNIMWNMDCSITGSLFIYQCMFLLLQVFPAMIIDSILLLCRMQPRLVRIQRKIFNGNLALGYFMTQKWNFINKNFTDARACVKSEDVEQFYYDIEHRDVGKFFENAAYGYRKYLFNEKDGDIPKAKAHLWRLSILDKILKVLVVGFIAWRFMQSYIFNDSFNYLKQLFV